MSIFNLCPHNFDLYEESQFEDLKQVNPTTWVADGVKGQARLSLLSAGQLRIKTSTIPNGDVEGVPTVKTQYGDLEGLPENVTDKDVLIVSLPAQSMAIASGHPLASRMASPYKVVRLASDTSKVLGCMGLSFQ